MTDTPWLINSGTRWKIETACKRAEEVIALLKSAEFPPEHRRADQTTMIASQLRSYIGTLEWLLTPEGAEGRVRNG